MARQESGPAGMTDADRRPEQIPDARRAPNAGRLRDEAETRLDPDGSPTEHAARGRRATSPLHMPIRGWKDIIWRTALQVIDDRVEAVAAGVAFYTLLAIFPGITALISIYGLFSDPSAVVEHIRVLGGILPDSAVQLMGDQMRRVAAQPQDRLGFGLAFSLGFALWSANLGMKAMFGALDVAYGEREDRSFVVFTLVTLGFTLVAILFTALMLAALALLPVALDLLNLGLVAEQLISLGRWPLLMVLVALGTSILYRYAPSRRSAKWRWVTPGGCLATLVWLAGSLGFSWYVSNIAAYDRTYGSLGAVVVFMTWIWISVMIVLVGAELNAELEHQTACDSTDDPQKPMGRRDAYVADTLGRLP